MKTLPKYFAIKAEDSELFDKFIEWFNKMASTLWKKVSVTRCADFYWRDWSRDWNGYDFYTSFSSFKNSPTLITLEEWDSIVNWTSQKKTLTYETQYLRSDWTLFTKDSIDWKSIEDLKQEMKVAMWTVNKIRGLLKAHKNKFQ